MLSPFERTLILGAITEWANGARDEPVFSFLENGEMMTPREVLVAVLERTSDGEAILQIVEHGVRRSSLSEVVAKIRSKATEDNNNNNNNLLYE